ncbi:histidine kinase [Microbacterium sp.]|uniref:sensor histidine kinase n=1 Tax=Microbacterium sp. TaxID=51671 RepID=UPI00333F192D
MDECDDGPRTQPRTKDWLLDRRALGDARGWQRLLAALTAPASLRWYPGAALSLLFALGFTIIPTLTQVAAPASWGIVAGLVLFCAMFVTSTPVALALPLGFQWVPPAVLMLFTIPLIGLLGPGSTLLWVYVAVASALCLGSRTAMIVVFSLALLSFLVIEVMAALDPAFEADRGTPSWSVPLVIGSVGSLMVAFARNLQTMRELRATQQELAAVAVEEERNRMARDMHDILGHSLSAIALKADLAAALSERDPASAAQEVREVQSLARATLGDMRAVVSGYRQVRVASELASIRALLAAAGLEAHLPSTTDDVPEENRELFGWTLREAATNILRHSQASECWVTLAPRRITIEDDGVGPAEGAGAGSGNGLHGLAERARDAGGAIRIGRSRRGGFLLEVSA